MFSREARRARYKDLIKTRRPSPDADPGRPRACRTREIAMDGGPPGAMLSLTPASKRGLIAEGNGTARLLHRAVTRLDDSHAASRSRPWRSAGPARQPWRAPSYPRWRCWGPGRRRVPGPSRWLRLRAHHALPHRARRTRAEKPRARALGGDRAPDHRAARHGAGREREGASRRPQPFSGSWPQFISEKRHRVSRTSPAGRCVMWRCT